MRLILIRHGQTSSNVGGNLDTTVPGAALTELGLEQAAALPRALTGESIGAIVASDQLRAQQTARPLSESLELEIAVRSGVREISAGSMEMRNDRSSVERYLFTVLEWAAGRLEVRMAGGEDGHEAHSRFSEVVLEIATLDLDTVVVVSHGAMIRSWVAANCRNVDVDFVAERPLTNTAVAILTGSPDTGWVAESWIGQAIGGPDVTDTSADGPVADPVADPVPRP